MDFVIIHTATRVVQGVTIDQNLKVPADFSLVEWKGAEKFTAVRGTKLDVGDASVSPASAAEVQEALDAREPKRLMIQNVKAKLDAAIADTNQANIKEALRALRALYGV